MSKNNGSVRKTASKCQPSHETIVRARKKLGLKAYHVGKKPLLSVTHCKKRMKFANQNKNRNWS